MKLLFCPHCQDVRKLPMLENKAGNYQCWCGKSWGYYTDDINAVYGGDAVMLGISNPSMRNALEAQKTVGERKDGKGWAFAAFIIPESAPTVRREK